MLTVPPHRFRTGTVQHTKFRLKSSLHVFYSRMDNGGFEEIDITPLSSPPDLPEVMKGQEATHETSN